MDHTPVRLDPPPAPTAGSDAARRWVLANLPDVTFGTVNASSRFLGGDTAAQQALAHTDLTGYAHRRNAVWPHPSRGATALSPYIRHGMLTLPKLWQFAASAPAADRDKFRDELLWQEYARHLYARLGSATARPLRHTNPTATTPVPDTPLTGNANDMACLNNAQQELDDTGFLTNQQRLWVASHFTVRNAWHATAGENLLYRQLLDGSRAANRLGWQWVSGGATGRPYAFTRRQVERYAPGLCDACACHNTCPIAHPPQEPMLAATDANPRLRRDPDAARTAGPTAAVMTDPMRQPQAVWVTAESLSITDPAVRAHPTLPVIFVFDTPLLARLKLATKRLVFLAETLGDLAQTRDVHVWRGTVSQALHARGSTDAARAVAATFAPVPGFRTRQQHVVELHPWPWLRQPHAGAVTSYTAWRKHSDSS